MKIELTFFDEQIDHQKGSKNGREWEMHSQHCDVQIPGERHPTTVKVNLPKSRKGQPFPKGTYEVPLRLYKDNFDGLKVGIALSEAKLLKALKVA